MALEINRVYEENYEVYGARKVWRQLGREDIVVRRALQGSRDRLRIGAREDTLVEIQGIAPGGYPRRPALARHVRPQSMGFRCGREGP